MTASLSELTIGSLALSPEFDPGVTEYTANTTNNTNTVTATAAEGTVTITVNDAEIENGTAATWNTGENTVVVTVVNGDAEKTYTVSVTKS